MPQPFLSDADFWVCVCYTALSQSDSPPDGIPLDGASCNRIARQLVGDPAYQSLDPVFAAQRYLQTFTAHTA